MTSISAPIDDSVPRTNAQPSTVEEKQEDARRLIAFGLVIAYVALLAINIALPITLYLLSKPTGPLTIENIKDLILAISAPVGGLSGILGFVVGFYFKSLDNKPGASS